MQLPPFLIPKPQNSTVAPIASQQPPAIVKESERTRFLGDLSSLCGHGFWFFCGASIAHLSRIVSAPIVLIASILLAGFLMVVKPENPTTHKLSMRRISGLLAILGTAVAFWDSAWLLATKPLGVTFGLIPLWQVGAFIGFLVLVNQLWRNLNQKGRAR
jgi:predicted membrane protein